MAQKPIITKDTTPEVIEKDIAMIRKKMSNTIDAIEERFSRAHVKGIITETIRDNVDKAKSRGREFANKARDSAARFGNAAREKSLQAKDDVPRFFKEDKTAASILAFEAGAWLVVAANGLINWRRRMQLKKHPAGSEYARARIMSIEEVAQKVEKAAETPEGGFKKAA